MVHCLKWNKSVSLLCQNPHKCLLSRYILRILRNWLIWEMVNVRAYELQKGHIISKHRSHVRLSITKKSWKSTVAIVTALKNSRMYFTFIIPEKEVKIIWVYKKSETLFSFNLKKYFMFTHLVNNHKVLRICATHCVFQAT